MFPWPPHWAAKRPPGASAADRRSSSASVTRPLPQPASRTRPSPRRSSRSITSRAIASWGSETRSYEAAFHSRGDIRLYVIAYAPRWARAGGAGRAHKASRAGGRRRRRGLRAVLAVRRLVLIRALG